jgi:hypothetical protein
MMAWAPSGRPSPKQTDAIKYSVFHYVQANSSVFRLPYLFGSLPDAAAGLEETRSWNVLLPELWACRPSWRGRYVYTDWRPFDSETGRIAGRQQNQGDDAADASPARGVTLH